MVGYRDFLDRRENFLKTLFDRIGKCRSSSEQYIALTKDSYAVANYPGKDARKQIEETRKSIKENFESNRSEWRSEQETLGMSVSYYYPDKQDDSAAAQYKVADAWRTLNDSLTKYTDCADSWVENNLRNNDTSIACTEELALLTKAMGTFTVTLDRNRTYVWEGWESPEKLRQALNKK